MSESQRPFDDDFVEFFRAGDPAVGAFACVACGHEITHRGVLPRCAACGNALWERGSWAPFATALSGLSRRLAVLGDGPRRRSDTPRTPAFASSRDGRDRSSAPGR